MAVTGKGDFPLVSTWLGRGRGRGRGRGLFTALYQNLPSQNTDPFTDLFFEAAAGGASYEIAGAATGSGTAAGDAKASRPIAGAATGAGVATGAATRAVSIAGAANGSGVASGAVQALRPIAGAATGTGIATGAVGAEAPVTAPTAGMAGGVTPEDVARIRRFLKREKEPITKLYKKLVRVKRYVPDATREQLVKVAAQYSTDAKPLTLDWLNFEAIMRAGDQERVKALINNAILAAEIAQADDDDDEDTLLLLYA